MLHFFYKVLLEEPLQGAVLTCLPEEEAEDYAEAIVFEPEMRVHTDEHGVESCTLVLPGVIDGYPLVALEDFMPEVVGEADDPPITAIELPASLVRIHPAAFEWLENLERFAVAPENPVFEAVDGILYQRAGGALLRCPMGWQGEALAVRQGTRRIAPNGLARCRELRSIHLPDGLELLDTYALSGCGALEYIRLPGSLRSIGMGCFQRCAVLPFIRLPDGVESIGEYAFADCAGLLGVQLPPGLGCIGAYAFRHCVRLGSITLPRGLKAIPGCCFDGCTRLAEVVWSRGGEPCDLELIDAEAFRGCAGLRELALPEGLRTIGQYAFSGCTALWRIQLPATLAEFFPSSRAANGMPFGGCTALERIEVAEGNTHFVVCDGALIGLEKKRLLCYPAARRQPVVTVPDWVRSIGTEAFLGHPAVEELRLPEELETISSAAFSHCTALQRVFLPDGLRRLSQSAFCGCTALESIRLPNGLRSIDRSTFEGCTALRQVRLPVSLERMEYAAFAGCCALEEIMLPEGLVELGPKVFTDCTGLRLAVLPRSLREVEAFASTFENCPALTLSIPRGTYAEEYFTRFGAHLKKTYY